METEPTVADVLRDAAGVLRERGWCIEALEDDEGHVCAVGAIQMATQGHTGGGLTDAAEAAKDVVSRFVGTFVVAWNNAIAGDGEHVAQTFEKAAAAWEEVHG